MINSNFNFRTALNEIKETKQSQNSIKVDVFLRKVITEISNKNVEISKEMLDEILFLHYYNSYYIDGRSCCMGEAVMIYIRKFNESNDKTENDLDLNSYLKIMDYAFSSVDEASIILKMAQEKLKGEDFDIKPYAGKHAYKNGHSFVLRDIPR